MSRPEPRRFAAEVAAGLSALRRGFSLWRHSPRLMLLGAAPALVVGAVFLAAFVALLVSLPNLVDWATPFADDWQPVLRTGTRVILGAGIVLLVGWAMVACYAATTLLVGDPFFEKIAHHVEQQLGNPPPGRDEGRWAGFVRQTSESLRLAGLGLALAVSLFLIGLIPVVGTVTGLVVGSVVGGRLLVTELTGRALDARGFDLDDRRRLLAARRVRSNAFGAAAYLLFVVPIVSVVAMPSVVAGATVLTRDLLPDPTPAPQDVDSAPGSGTIVPPGGFA
ncbi:MAG: EI24 domain-containing protein [Micrococcales bacterium]|nr:EI24 domain-containing protein [Micrococcales bacterium]